MAMAPPAPPPPPESCGKQPRSTPPPLIPEFAAKPFCSKICPPVQETCPLPEAAHEEAQDAPLLPAPDGPPSPPSEGQEDSLSDGEEKKTPVQETEPAQQMAEQQNEEANPPHAAGEDQSP